MNQITQAVILAAGMGSRLKAFTEHTPKALMPIADEPAIVRIIHTMVASGIHDIAINLHYHGEQIKEVLGNGASLNARLYYSEEPHLLNSGGGVRTAMDLLPEDDGLIVYNADIMSDIHLGKLAKLCPEQGCALTLVDNPYHHKEGDFSLSGQHVTPKASQPLTFSGVSAWSKATLLRYPTKQKFSLIEPMHACISEEQCNGFHHHGHWFDIGRPHDLVQASRYYYEHAL